jgi:hypothetical protein
MFIFFLGLIHRIYVVILQVTLPEIVLPVEWKREMLLLAAVSAHVQTCGSFFKHMWQQITNKTHPDNCTCWKWFLLLCMCSSTSVKCSHPCMEVPSQKQNKLETRKLKPWSPVQSI